ncbi:MAG: helix-turn-helix transcriptional regulator [Clostridia bacterium]|nr:helix-turn-helix transcriptional regulator [Clostridia bacterium]
MANIAINIKKLRLQKGITQEAFAKTVNVSRQAISSWETGRTQPDIEMIGTLAEALDVSIEELIYGEKRNIKIDDTEKSYVSTATVVLSILGGFMLLAGAILILVWSWNHVPVVAKTVYALVPAGLGVAFAMYVLKKMKNDSFMVEIGSLSWAIGNIVSLIFIKELFEYNLEGIHIAAIALALTLPVMLIMKSVSALTVFYGAIAYGLSALWNHLYEAYNWNYDFEKSYIILLSTSLFIAILFVHLYRNKIDYARHRYAQCASLIITLHFIYMTFVNNGFINPFVALLAIFSICSILEKENDLTDPLYIFGTLGSTATMHIYLISQGDYIGGYLEEEIPVLLLSVLFASLAIWKNKNSLKENLFKKLQLTIIFICAVFSAIHSAVYRSAYIISAEATTLTVIFDSAAIFVFPICIFTLALIFITQGLKENRLYPLNLGFVSIAALAIILLTAFETDMLIKGCVLLLMGGILMFMNLKITKKKEKEKKKETPVEEVSDTQG